MGKENIVEGARAAGCGKCGKAADKRCGSCHQVSYCCPEHQKADWKEHRKVCCPFMVKYSDELGRYLVASRDLKERTLVIKEAPFTFAPYDQADEDEIGVDQAPMCLGCCCRMSDMPDARCSTCHWPVCSKACEETPSHANYECLILAGMKVAYPPPKRRATCSSILILRLLLQKERNPKLWSEFLKMEHHTKLRSQKDTCNRDDGFILENLRKYLDGSVIKEQEIREIIGRVSVNSFGTSRQEEGKKDLTVGRGVYLKTGIVAHSCVPNAVWGISNSPDFNIIVKTSVPIKKGELITPTYSDLWNSLGTYHRLSAMFERSHFICKCQRCVDPTELGTFISAIKCPKCCRGNILPSKPVDLSDRAVWRCDSCGAGDVQRAIANLVDDIQYEINEKIEQVKDEEEGTRAVEELEELFEKFCGTILHENHFGTRSIQKAIIEKMYPLLESCSFKELDTFIRHCESLLRVTDILTPGYTAHGGTLRSYLRDGLLQKKIKAVAEGCVSAVFKSSKAFDQHLRKLEQLNLEATLHLENDPDTSPNY